MIIFDIILIFDMLLLPKKMSTPGIKMKTFDVNGEFQQGVIKFDIFFLGIKQCKGIAILRDLPFYTCIVWVGNIMTPVQVFHHLTCQPSLQSTKESAIIRFSKAAKKKAREVRSLHRRCAFTSIFGRQVFLGSRFLFACLPASLCKYKCGYVEMEITMKYHI